MPATQSPPGKNRGPIEYTSISAEPFPYPNAIRYIQVVSAGSGGLVVKDEGGVTRTYTALGAGDVLVGPFTELTSMTLSKIRVGDGDPPKLTPVSSILAATSTGNGADAVGYPDKSSKTAKTTTGDAIDEIYVGLLSNQKTHPIPLGGAIDIATGALLAVFADGATTTPGTQFTNSKTSAIRWNNHATPGAIAVNVAMPQDLDDTASVVFHALVSKTGATLGDALKLTVGAFEHVPAAAHDADTDFGGDSSAVVGDATAKTVTEVTLTLAASDIHPAPTGICFTIKPKAGTLGTDDALLHSAWLEYTPVLLTS